MGKTRDDICYYEEHHTQNMMGYIIVLLVRTYGEEQCRGSSVSSLSLSPLSGSSPVYVVRDNDCFTD